RPGQLKRAFCSSPAAAGEAGVRATPVLRPHHPECAKSGCPHLPSPAAAGEEQIGGAARSNPRGRSGEACLAPTGHGAWSRRSRRPPPARWEFGGGDVLYSARFPLWSNGARVRNLTIWQAVAYASELGVTLAATVLVGTGVGYLLDQWLRNGAPVFTIIGSLLGLAAGTL